MSKFFTVAVLLGLAVICVAANNSTFVEEGEEADLLSSDSTFRQYIKELAVKVARKAPSNIKRGMSWDTIKQKLNSGDIVLFSGSAVVPSLLTRIMTHSFFTHLGMVVKMPDGELYLWQSVPEKSNDYLHKYFPDKVSQYHTGAAMIPLKEAIWEYNKEEDNEDARVFVRLLEGTARTKNSSKGRAFLRNLKSALIEFSEKPFPKTWIPGVKYPIANALGMLESNILGAFHIEVEQTYFCSQLIAATYEHLNLMDQKYVTNYYQPSHFSPEKKMELTDGRFTDYLIEFDVKSPEPPQGEFESARKKLLSEDGTRLATVREMFERAESNVV